MMQNRIFECDTKDEFAFSQQKLMQHFGSLLINDGVCGIMTKEIHRIKSPAVQNMVDNWHRSGAKSWEQWVNHSPLNNIRQHNQETFHELENYQSQFTQNVYAPLSQYLLSSHNKFKGTANDLIKRILAVYKHVKLRNIAPNCCMQIDLRSQHNIIESGSLNNEELEWDDEEREEEVYQSDNKEEMALEQESVDDAVLNESIDQIMNECVMPYDGNYYYKRYEVMIYDKELKIDEAISNNSIPQCAFNNAPLCMIFNSTASVGKILHELCPKTMGLISVSFHVYHRSINVYLYVADGEGKLFGSRVFGDDLISIIPLLFEYSKPDKLIMDQLNNYIQWKPDAVYKQYYLYLIQHTLNQNENKYKIDDIFQVELDPLFASKLEEIVNSWNGTGNKHIINAIKKCFSENNVNHIYFQNHKRKDLTQLLKRYQIKAAVAIKIWRAFAEEHELKATPKADNGIIPNVVQNAQSVQEENQMLLERIQLLEQENQDLKRVIENAMSDAPEDDPQIQQTEHDEDHHEPNILANLSWLIFENNQSLIPAQLNKNGICLSGSAVHRELGYYYQKETGCLHQLTMVQEALFFLCILYLYNMYKRLDIENILDSLRRHQRTLQ